MIHRLSMMQLHAELLIIKYVSVFRVLIKVNFWKIFRKLQRMSKIGWRDHVLTNFGKILHHPRLISFKRAFWIWTMKQWAITYLVWACFIKSVKVENRKWWCSDRHCLVPSFCYKGDAIFVEMNLKFPLFLKLFQNLFLCLIGDI